MEFVDVNIGSKLTAKYPAIYLVGDGASGEVRSVAYAGKGQHQDTEGQDGARRPEHHLENGLQVDQSGRRHNHLPRSGQR